LAVQTNCPKPSVLQLQMLSARPSETAVTRQGFMQANPGSTISWITARFHSMTSGLHTMQVPLISATDTICGSTQAQAAAPVFPVRLTLTGHTKYTDKPKGYPC